MTEPQIQPTDHRPRPWLAAGVLLALSWAVQLVVVFGPGMGGGQANDERVFHLPTIRLFAEQMPAPDVSDYNVATTPGYHLLLAAVSNLGASSDTALRLIGGQFAVALSALVAFWLGCRLRWLFAVALALPVALSSYNVGPMVLALPESAAWLGVLAIVMIALRPKIDMRWQLAASCVLVVLVCVRQIHLWAAAVIWLAAWLGSQEGNQNDRLVPTLSELELPRRVPRTLIAAALTLPAFAAVAWFFNQWGGPVPPTFQTDSAADAVQGAAVHSGGNLATPAMILALFGVLAPAFVLAVLPELMESLKQRREAVGFVVAGAAAGLVVSALPETSMSVEHGRWTGLWSVAGKLPVVAERSPVIIGLAVLGGALLAGLLTVVHSRQRLVLGWALFAFTVAQCANYQSWARYLLPMVLLMLILLTGLALGRVDRPGVRRLVGPVLLACVLGAGSVARIVG